MNYLKKISYLSVCAIFLSLVTASSAQDRARVVKQVSSQPVNQPKQSLPTVPDKTRSLVSSTPVNTPASRPTLTNKIVVKERDAAYEPLVTKTGISSPANALTAAVSKANSAYSTSHAAGMMRGIQSRLGIPYRYGSSGPNRYDCSGFVWAVFKDAGLDFERTSARSLWTMSEPVTGDERYKFGTLVFLNRLGHIGIVADENGFFHASSSKGITYSTFKGYWENRIVGFRRLNVQPKAAAPIATAAAAK
ncbi:MAG TPA: NlpC/P60 family protein [Pyrinomonadaceae bacterium]|nr:NlpC/P60 family protein [Pyrinomonadaceae bacterium]